MNWHTRSHTRCLGQIPMNETILIADDDDDIRQLIAFTLRTRGYAVVEASDGESALALTRREQPALVILDVMMPAMTGIEVARKLVADAKTARIPIVLLSAKGQKSEIEEGLSSGAQEYLVKPFAPRELAAKVAEILRAESSASQETFILGSTTGNVT